MSDRLTVAADRRNIFTYTDPAYPDRESISIDREPDGRVTVSVCEGIGRGFTTLFVPSTHLRKLVSAFALEPDLWPGCDCEVTSAQAEVGKPYGGPVQ